MVEVKLTPKDVGFRIGSEASLYQEIEEIRRHLVLSQEEWQAGDLMYFSDATTFKSLAIGDTAQILGVNGGQPSWETASSYLGHVVLDGAYHPDTVGHPVVPGDIIYGNATPLWDALPIGGVGQILGIATGLPSWVTPSSYLAHSLLGPFHSDTLPSPPLAGHVIVGNAPGTAWEARAPGGPGGLLHFNGTDTLFTTTMLYTDAASILSFTDPTTITPATTLDVEVGGNRVTRIAAGEFQVGRSGRRLIKSSQIDATGRFGFEAWPDDFTISTATGAGGSLIYTDAARKITLAIPGGGGVGDDVAPGGMNFVHTVRFEDPGFIFASQLLINAAVKVECAANVGPLYLFLDQYNTYADGGSYVCSQHNAMRAQPKWGPNINGGSITQTSAELYLAFASVDATVGTANVILLNYFAAKTPGLTAGGTIGTLNVLDIQNIVGPGTIRGINSAMANGTFINHTGVAASVFAGTIRMNDAVTTIYGSSGSAGVSVSRIGAGVLRLIGVGGSNNEGIDINFESNPNNISITSPTGPAGLNFDLLEIAFGPSTIADGTNNWVFAFSPGLRTTSLNGEYSEVLFTSASSISVVHAISRFATWTVNAPSVSLGGGSIVDATNVLIQTNMSVGTNRYGLLILSNPTGGTLNYSMRVAGLSRFDAGIDLFGTLMMNGATSGILSHAVPAIVTTHTLTWPSAQGGAGTRLQNDGAGVLSWAAVVASGPTGSGVANQVAYWSAPTVLAGTIGFEWFPGTDIFQIFPTGTKRRLKWDLNNAAAPWNISTITLQGARAGSLDRWLLDITGASGTSYNYYEIRSAGAIVLTPRGRTTILNDSRGVLITPVASFNGNHDMDLLRLNGAAGGTNELVNNIGGSSVAGAIGVTVAVRATGASNFFYAFRMNITEYLGAPINQFLLAKWQYNSVDVFGVDSDGDVWPRYVKYTWPGAAAAGILGSGVTGILTWNQAADIVALTDSTTGTANDTVVAIAGSGDDANINDNFADLIAKINGLRTALQNVGAMA